MEIPTLSDLETCNFFSIGENWTLLLANVSIPYASMNIIYINDTPEKELKNQAKKIC